MSEDLNLAVVAGDDYLGLPLVESPSPLPVLGGDPVSPLSLDFAPSVVQEHISLDHVAHTQTQYLFTDQDLDAPRPIVDEPESIHGSYDSVRRRSRTISRRTRLFNRPTATSNSSDVSVHDTPLPHTASSSGGPDSPVVPLRDTSAAWKRCSKRLRMHDQSIVKGWKEDIDTLLVLAGLLSAVITAFNIQSYQMLQQDSKDVLVSILQQMSAQISNNSLPIATIPHWSKPTSAIWINVLWFSSLVFSLTAALIGILVKQWLRDYLSSAASSPRESARVRQFRHQGLVRWHIPEIIAFLPIFLQVALAFFFLGLLELLWMLDRVVAGIVTVFVAASLLFLVITTVLPAIYEDSPHRSPQALAIFFIGWRLSKFAGSVALRCFTLFGWTQTQWPLNMNTVMFRSTRRKLIAWAREMVGIRTPRSWMEREKLFVQGHTEDLDHQILAGADAVFMDDSFLSQVVRVCVNDIQTPAALGCLCDILENRSHGFSPDGTPLWRPYELVDKGFATLMHLVADILCRIDATDREGILRVLRILDKLCKAMPFESESPEAKVLYQRVYSALARLLYHDSDVQRTAFNLVRDLFSRSTAPVDGVVIESILSFARSARVAGDDDAFHVACSIVLSFATTDLSPRAYQRLRDRLKTMLEDLESHLNRVILSPLPNRPTPSPSLLVALVDIVAVDPELVGDTLIETLNALITGTTYGPAGSRATSQAHQASERAVHYLNLRRAYGGRVYRRKREKVVYVKNLSEINLTLPSESGSPIKNVTW